MKPNATHTAHALSELLETDRSTMIRCLRSVPPDAQTKGRPTWKISTAARALEAHRRKGEGHSSGGADPALQLLFDRHFAAEARMRALPTLAARREAAHAMIPAIVEMDKATRQTGVLNGHDSDVVHMRADHMLRLYARGIEGPCEWTHDQVWEMFNDDDETEDA